MGEFIAEFPPASSNFSVYVCVCVLKGDNKWVYSGEDISMNNV